MAPTPVLVVDFDDTITEGDTIGTLIDASIEAQARGDSTSQGQQNRRSALHSTKDRLVAEYVEAFQALTERHLPQRNMPAKDTGLNMELASGFLDDLNDFEQRMNAKVVESSILSGLQDADIDRAARQIRVRPHARETIKTALQLGWHVHVLSVNWSAALIRCVLAGLPSRIETDAGDNVEAEGPGQAVVIHANSLEMQLGISTGSIVCHMQGPVDKGTVLEDILLSIAAISGDGSAPCIYVGDSVGDLSALLVANFPIVVGENAVLAHALSAFSCHVQPLQEAPVAIADADDAALPQGHVLKASSWREIYDFLFPPGAGAAGRPRGDGDLHTVHLGERSSGGTAPVTPPAGSGAGDRYRPTLSGAVSSSGNSPAARRTAEEMLQTAPASGSRGYVQTPSRSVLPPRVLAVAGSDSGGGAGIQADLRACMANHAFAMTAVTALTAQNSQGVHSVHAVPGEMVAAQMDAVLGDIGADCVKTGMMPSAEVVRVVGERLRAARAAGASLQVVVDPVLVSTSGSELGAGDVAAALKKELFPLATVITPNLAEASRLLDGRKITTVSEMQEAARDLADLGPKAVLVKGGHLPVPDRGSSAAAATLVDVLYNRSTEDIRELATPRLTTDNTHGTGCTMASAIAAHLARGESVHVAVEAAQRYVHECIARSVPLSLGGGSQGAMDHGAGLVEIGGGGVGRGVGREAAAARATRRVQHELDYSVYAVTDDGMNARHSRPMDQAVREAVAGGATVIQIRQKKSDGGVFLEAVQAAIRAARPAGVPVIVNDRVDVALAAGADGVHVGQGDIPCSEVRRMVGERMIVGVSANSVAEARQAAEDGADYVGVGAVFATATKAESAAIGLEGLREVAEAAPVPVVAIGGVNSANAASVMTCGCAGVAVVSCVFDQEDIVAAVHSLRRHMGLKVHKSTARSHG